MAGANGAVEGLERVNSKGQLEGPTRGAAVRPTEAPDGNQSRRFT